MTIPIFQVDAFTSTPFRGNPAGVCLLDRAAGEAWMRDVAREMNVSETAFLAPKDGALELRWFTPAVEVALCGHATLATAHVLWETGRLGASEEARFTTRSGVLTARRDGGDIVLDFPATPPEACDPPPGLVEALGAQPRFVGRSQHDYLVEVESEDAVKRCAPDLARLRTLPVRGVIVTSAAFGASYDFVSRFFAPAAGVDEDPVTGSAHCALGPFWSARLERPEMVAYQASERGGVLRVRVVGDRVLLFGRAVTVIEGRLLAPLA